MIVEIIWSLVALGGFLRAIWLWREAVLDQRALGTNANGRRLLAKWQVEHASMGILIYFSLLCAGVSALIYRFEFIPLRARLLIASLCLVAALLTLATRQERDAHYRRRTLEGRDMDDVVRDTNRRVREIQKRGQSDQPLEETDRFEGHMHREAIENAVESDRAERKEERRLDREERAAERQDDRDERASERRVDDE